MNIFAMFLVRWGHIHFLLLWVSTCFAQPALDLEKITIAQGLSQGFVSAICQDREGFLWFGTNNGLNRYDGYEFTVFRHDPYEPYSISHNEVKCIAEAGEFLYIATATGLDKYDKHSRRFYHLPVPDNPANLSPQKLLSDGRQTLWLLHTVSGRNVLHRMTIPATAIHTGGKPVDAMPAVSVPLSGDCTDISLSADGQMLWILQPDGLYRLDAASGAVQAVPVRLPGPGRWLNPDGGAGVWVQGREFILHFDPATPGQPGRLHHLQLPHSKLAHFDPLNQFLLLRQPDMCGFDMRNLPDTISPADARLHLHVPEGLVSSLTDRNGITWLGTNAYGVRKFSPRAAVFKNYLAGVSINCPLVTDNFDRVWLAKFQQLDKDPVFNQVLNLATGQLSPYPFAKNVSGLHISRTTADDAGGLWTAGIGETANSTAPLVYYRPDTDKTEIFYYPKSADQIVTALAVSYESPGRVWIFLPDKILRFDVSARHFDTFDFSQVGRGATEVFCATRTEDGTHWIGLGTGIVRAEPNGTGFRFALLQNDPADRNSLPVNSIKSLLTDPADGRILWIGTAGGGLSRLDTRTNIFTHFNTRNGLPDDVVYGILPESAPPGGEPGCLWISTNKGLTKFNPATRQFQYFYQSDGLPDNEFNTYASGLRPNGELLFGGVNGLTVFNPKDLTAKTQAPVVRIVGLKINGSAIYPGDSTRILQQSIEFTEALVLPYAQNSISLQFAALDYTRPERNRFKFYLAGAENEWAHEGFEHTAQYLNLAPGRYTFRVLGANSDGVWSEQTAALRIEVLPPWWRSWWAYALYFLTGSALIYGIFRYRLEEALRVERLRTRISSDLHDEVGSVLSGLAMQSEFMEFSAPEADKSRLRHMAELARGAMSNMRDVVWAIDTRKDNLQALEDRMQEFAAETLEPLNIVFSLVTTGLNPTRHLNSETRQNLYLIFKEAIANVVRHSDATRVELHLQNVDGGLAITIRDNGTRQPGAGRSAGQGLANMRMRAKKIKAQIEFDWQNGFVIRLRVLSYRNLP